MTHFLQTGAWERFQQDINRTTIRDQGDEWRYLAVVEPGQALTRLYCPYGPEIDYSGAFLPAVESLKRAASEQNAAYIRIEPTGHITPAQLREQGFRKVKSSQPEHTWQIDLAPSEDELLANMSQPNRNGYRNYQKKDIKLHTSQNPADIAILITLLNGMAEHNKITIHSDAYFTQQAASLMPTGNATLYYATFKNQAIAATLVYDSETTRYYAHAAADYDHRKLAAGALLVSSLIIDAKQKGLKAVDLYGITTSEDPRHPWAGFTKFKQSFGGHHVGYVGCWELPLQPTRYRLYRLGLVLYRLVKR